MLQMKPHNTAHPQPSRSYRQAEMITPPLRSEALRNPLFPPFSLITMFAPPFLAGYQHHRMKERWCKSARCTVALTYHVTQSDYDNNVETTTYVNSKPHPLAKT